MEYRILWHDIIGLQNTVARDLLNFRNPGLIICLASCMARLRSSLRIEPFAARFWVLGIVLLHMLKQLTQPAGLSLNSGTGTVLYGRGTDGHC